jgi:hypothetical protein
MAEPFRLAPGTRVRPLRLTITGLLSAAALVRIAVGQITDRSASRPDRTLPTELAQIDDFSFSYAQPGFYAVLERVKRTGLASLDTADPISITDWRDLLERSADFRGRTITVDGFVGRNTAWKPLDPAQHSLGAVWELQLQRDDQPLICKCILIGDAGDIPIGARVQISGIYIMIQQYYSESKRQRQAALLVGVGPTTVSQDRPRSESATRDNTVAVVLALLTGLALAWFLLRRHLGGRAAVDHRELRAERAAPLHLADDLDAWARQDEKISKNVSESKPE